MKRILKLAAAGVVAMCASSAVHADEALTHAQLQKLFPGKFTAVVHGSTKVTFTAQGNGILIGEMPGKHDSGRWSLRDGKLCVMLTTWTQGKSACSAVVADSGWYRGQGIKFRKI
jgi:hypothetical protein